MTCDKSQWCKGRIRVSGTLGPGSSPGWDVFVQICDKAKPFGISSSPHELNYISNYALYDICSINHFTT